ncbi:hypothetical protein HOLleu_35644 [Holothuria leucospilota]|uniref:Uncharacterized protein n=1 Tax=Holothuria leucospilota TaxID=206669 RepID=A0A9Q0YN84_HOLLE|nr:hypothetical protein HOLleu_35644 [Holothuria leucospilota]
MSPQYEQNCKGLAQGTANTLLRNQSQNRLTDITSPSHGIYSNFRQHSAFLKNTTQIGK